MKPGTTRRLYRFRVQLIYFVVLAVSIAFCFSQQVEPPWILLFATLLAICVMGLGRELIRFLGFNVPERTYGTGREFAKTIAPWVLTTFLTVIALSELWCFSMCHCSDRPGFRFIGCPLVMIGLVTTR